MKLPMTILAFLAVVGGFLQIPGVDDTVTRFLSPTFAGSRLYNLSASVGGDWVGLVIGALIAVAGIGTAYRFYIAKPGSSAVLQARFSAVHTFLYNKWYFDELIDILVVRPALAIGSFANRVFERFVVDGIVNGTRETVGGAGGVVRAVQNGFVRSYALLLLVGFAGLALYFLIQS